jgi:hypothetical protein
VRCSAGGTGRSGGAVHVLHPRKQHPDQRCSIASSSASQRRKTVIVNGIGSVVAVTIQQRSFNGPAATERTRGVDAAIARNSTASAAA